MIEIRYLYDQNGNRTDVIIPISAWSEDMERIIKGNFCEQKKFVCADSKVTHLYK